MTRIICGCCDEKTEEILGYFSEVEYCDPRLILIVGFARIHTAIRDLVAQRASRQTNGRKPAIFKTETSSLRRANVLDSSYYEFLRRLAAVRNTVCHRLTKKATLEQEPHWGDLVRMHELSSVAPVWPEPIHPADDMSKSAFAICIAGCLAVELDFEGQPRGFSALAGRIF
ncbi:MAG: hypothetical protein IT422_03150 [Pirellulaceae bacterium]|nr:hypothetical protein [Pirellulaceae bacterium]